MNNNLMVIESSNVLTMSSREIAELTGKRHDNVMVDIVKMFKDLGDEGGSPGRTGHLYSPSKWSEIQVLQFTKR